MTRTTSTKTKALFLLETLGRVCEDAGRPEPTHPMCTRKFDDTPYTSEERPYYMIGFLSGAYSDTVDMMKAIVKKIEEDGYGDEIRGSKCHCQEAVC